MRLHCAARQLDHNEDGSIPISPEIDMDERRFSERAFANPVWEEIGPSQRTLIATSP